MLNQHVDVKNNLKDVKVTLVNKNMLYQLE